jgi:MFS family permease
LIVVLVVPISIVVAKIRTLAAMIGGMVVAIGGILVSGLTMSGWVLLLGIVLFSLGEMLTGPKKNQYLAMIAPEGKKGLYLGYVNIPVGLGVYVGSKLAGYLYGNFGEKAVLAQKYLAQKTDWLSTKGKGPWNGDLGTLESTLGVARTEAFEILCKHTSNDPVTMTTILWDTYQPYLIWLPFAAIGVASTIGLAIFASKATKWADMNK